MSRTEKQIRSLIDAAIVTTGGGLMPLALLHYDDAEEALFREGLKGRRGVKSLSLKRGTAADLAALDGTQSLAERFGTSAPEALDYDGY